MDYLVGCMSYISFCAIKFQFIELKHKTAYKGVGGLISWQDYLTLSFLLLAESTVQRTSSTASVYLPCLLAEAEFADENL